MGEVLLYFALINQLDHKKYHNRDVATKFLSAMSINALPYVSQFTDSPHAELARRANNIMNNISIPFYEFASDASKKDAERMLKACQGPFDFNLGGNK